VVVVRLQVMIESFAVCSGGHEGVFVWAAANAVKGKPPRAVTRA
jgi:hypothetical protein